MDITEASVPFSPDSPKLAKRSSWGGIAVNSNRSGLDPRQQFDICEEQSIELETLFEEVPPANPTLSPDLKSSEVKVSPGEEYTRTDKSCFYVPVKIGKVRGSFLIDTGSTVSVLSSKVVSMIGRTTNLQPVVEKLTTANGQELKLKGKLELQIQLEHLDFSQAFIVAEIDEELGILGMDFLQENDANFKLGKRILKTSTGKLRLYKQTSKVCARLVLEDTVEIPPRSEVFLKGYVDRTSPGVVGIFEPNEKFLTQGLFVV